MRRSTLARLTAAALLAGAGSAMAEPRRLTLEQAVDLAIKQNLDLSSSDLAAQAADQDTLAARGSLGPKFHVDANVFLWNEPYKLSFTLPGLPAVGPILARDRASSTITASVTQPLTGLYSSVERRRANADLADAARADGKSLRAELAYRATEAYLRLLAAIDLRRIALETISDIEEQVRTAKALVQAGTLIPADQLRTEVQLAQTRQDFLRSDAQVGVARGMLATIVGLPVDAEIEPERIDVAAMPKLPARVDTPLSMARKNRTEITAAQSRRSAAEHSAKAAWGDMLPSLSAEMAYQHNEGVPFGVPQNAGFIGGVLSWNFFEWGTQYFASEAAKVRTKAASNEVARRDRDIGLEVYRRFLEVKAAYSAIEPARTAVDQAREARRVTKALYENGSATTTDLLNAELSLETSRANDARSSYDALTAYAALARAAGVYAVMPKTTGQAADASPMPLPPPASAPTEGAPRWPAPPPRSLELPVPGPHHSAPATDGQTEKTLLD